MTVPKILNFPYSTLILRFIQAYKANVICPNKHQSDPEKFYKNHLLESETYIGGHVECLESGVFRSDLPTNFRLDAAAYEVCLKIILRTDASVYIVYFSLIGLPSFPKFSVIVDYGLSDITSL